MREDREPLTDKQQEILHIINPYKEYIHSVDAWSDFRDKHKELKLPHKNTIIKHFGRWNTMKGYLLEEDVFPLKFSYSKEELLEILKQNKNHIDTAAEWEKYRKNNLHLQLPTSSTITKGFGRWNTMKEELGLPTNKNQPRRLYTDKDLLQLIDEYYPYMQSGRTWREFAQANELPSYYTFVQRLGRERFNALRKKHYDNK